jgi:hypothetical protein
MLFTDEFIFGIVEKPIESIIEVCKVSFQLRKGKSYAQLSIEDHDVLLECYALIQSIFEDDLLVPITRPISFTGDRTNDSKKIIDYIATIYKHFTAQETNLRVQSLSSKFKTKLGSGFTYEFTQGDIDRIQALINELREQISKSDFIEESHKSRLLKRLEHLQAEMHKRMSDLDKFWGLVGDAGVAIGKFGKDAKPIVDRIKEITDIIWRTQSKAEELPSSIENPMLPSSSTETDEE